MKIIPTSFEFEDQDIVTIQVDVFTPALVSYTLTFDPSDFFDLSVSEMQELIGKAVLKIMASGNQLDQIIDKQFSISAGNDFKKAYA